MQPAVGCDNLAAKEVDRLVANDVTHPPAS